MVCDAQDRLSEDPNWIPHHLRYISHNAVLILTCTQLNSCVVREERHEYTITPAINQNRSETAFIQESLFLRSSVSCSWIIEGTEAREHLVQIAPHLFNR